MSEQSQQQKGKSLLAGMGFLIPIVLLLVGGILVLVYPPGDLGIDIIIPAIVIIGVTILLFLYWAIHAFQQQKILNLSKKGLRRIFRVFTVFWAIISIGAGSIGIFIAMQVRGIWLNDAGPYLTWDSEQDPTNAITICWQTNQPAASEVHYGTQIDALEHIISSNQTKIFHQIALEGLTPDTTYYYRAGSFNIKQFHTARAGLFNFTFLWWSDPRTNGDLPGAITGPNMPKIMADLMMMDGTEWDFSMCTGDVSNRAYNNDTWRIWVNDIATDEFASTKPHVLVPGNHERTGNTTAEIFKQYYPYDEMSGLATFCRSFDYGNTHFVMMDPWDITSGWWYGDKTMYANWLRADLKAHNASKFTIMAMHPNPVIIGDHSGNQTQIMNVAREFGVDLILCGHHHSYKTFNMDGTEFALSNKTNTLDSLILMQGEGGNSGTPGVGSFSQIDITSENIRIHTRSAMGMKLNEFIITGV
jgi:hypothetical protein